MDVRARIKLGIRRRRARSIRRLGISGAWGGGRRFGVGGVFRAGLFYLALVLFVAGFILTRGTGPRSGESISRGPGGFLAPGKGASLASEGPSFADIPREDAGLFSSFRTFISGGFITPSRVLTSGIPFLSQDRARGLSARGGLTPDARVSNPSVGGVPAQPESKLLEEGVERPRTSDDTLIRPELPPVKERRPSLPDAGRVREAPTKGWGEKPLVIIYHSHSSEAYKPTSGVNYVWGKPDGVIAVGRVLTRELENFYHIPVVHSEEIHDFPVWREAYMNSLITVTRLLKENPSAEVVIDIHRDSVPATIPAGGTVKFGARRAARVLIVVSNDKFGLPHPHWRENYAFAKYLAARAEEMYPGLVRGVDLRSDGRWNQHVHPRAIILEMGSVSNSRAEAEEAAVLMADVIASVLDDLRR